MSATHSYKKWDGLGIFLQWDIFNINGHGPWSSSVKGKEHNPSLGFFPGLTSSVLPAKVMRGSKLCFVESHGIYLPVALIRMAHCLQLVIPWICNHNSEAISAFHTFYTEQLDSMHIWCNSPWLGLVLFIADDAIEEHRFPGVQLRNLLNLASHLFNKFKDLHLKTLRSIAMAGFTIRYEGLQFMQHFSLIRAFYAIPYGRHHWRT